MCRMGPSPMCLKVYSSPDWIAVHGRVVSCHVGIPDVNPLVDSSNEYDMT